MQLFVRGLDGSSCSSVDLLGIHTVLQLQEHIQAQHGVPVSEQLLTTIGGKPLYTASASLASSGLSHGSTVQLLLRLCGGKGGFGALLRGQGRDGKITDNFDAMRDLSGRRVRHVEAEKKLKEWEQDSKERELEKLALQHMKHMARQAKKERDYQVNVEEVKREHKEAADRVVEAVHTALAEGLHQQQKHNGSGSKSSSGDGSSGSGSAETAAAVDSGAAAGSKRKQQASAAAAGAKGSGSPAKRRKPTMLDLVEGSDSGSDSDDSDAE
jgi:hypothetical protein